MRRDARAWTYFFTSALSSVEKSSFSARRFFRRSVYVYLYYYFSFVFAASITSHRRRPVANTMLALFTRYFFSVCALYAPQVWSTRIIRIRYYPYICASACTYTNTTYIGHIQVRTPDLPERACLHLFARFPFGFYYFFFPCPFLYRIYIYIGTHFIVCVCVCARIRIPEVSSNELL